MGLQDEILNEALANDVCEKFKKELQRGGLTEDQLCMMYHRGLDFCIEHNFPSQRIVDMFDAKVLHRNGIYYNIDGRVAPNAQFIVINGESDLDLTIGRMASVYVRDTSKVCIRLAKGAFVYVTLLDNAIVEIAEKAAGSKALMSYHSGTIINEEMFDQIHYKKED